MSEWTVPHPRSNPGHSWHSSPKAKSRACMTKSLPAAQFIRICDVTWSLLRMVSPQTPRQFCFQTSLPSKQISSDFSPLEFGNIWGWYSESHIWPFHSIFWSGTQYLSPAVTQKYNQTIPCSNPSHTSLPALVICHPLIEHTECACHILVLCYQL